MNTIKPDAVSLTTHHLHLALAETDAVLAAATGFAYERGGALFLITAWHNVSGRDPMTGKPLSESLAVPDIVSTLLRDPANPARTVRKQLQLYRDSDMATPAWFEHPRHGSSVDVIAIPIPEDVSASCKIYPINHVPFEQGFATLVADDAFIVGYPFMELTDINLPVWKRATVASEPDVDIGGMPKLLVDTATRPGLSGSPVIMQRIGIHGMENGELTGSTTIGRIRSFIGVYSGRLGVDEVKAQLGIVWKASVLDEVIDSKVWGKPMP